MYIYIFTLLDTCLTYGTLDVFNFHFLQLDIDVTKLAVNYQFVFIRKLNYGPVSH